MKIVTLNLGSLAPQQVSRSTGWYYNPQTLQKYYYNASTGIWYILTAQGILVPLTISEENAPSVTDLAPGNTLRIVFTYNYKGPAIPAGQLVEYVSLGVKGLLTYDEKASHGVNRALPQCTTPTTFTSTIDLVVPSNAQSDWNDIEAKVTAYGVDGDKELGKRYLNALNIVGITPDFTNFTIVSYNKVTV